MSGNARYTLVTSIDRVSKEFFYGRDACVCDDKTIMYQVLGSYNDLLRSHSDAIKTDYEKVLKRHNKEELRTCPGCKDLIKIAFRLH